MNTTCKSKEKRPFFDFKLHSVYCCLFIDYVPANRESLNILSSLIGIVIMQSTQEKDHFKYVFILCSIISIL